MFILRLLALKNEHVKASAINGSNNVLNLNNALHTDD